MTLRYLETRICGTFPYCTKMQMEGRCNHCKFYKLAMDETTFSPKQPDGKVYELYNLPYGVRVKTEQMKEVK